MFLFILLGLIVLSAILLKVISVLDAKSKVHNTNAMIKSCVVQKNSNALQLIVFGQDTEELSETVFSIFQNAECPRNLRLHIFEQVEAYEEESSALRRYIVKCSTRGKYMSDFKDLIVLHQVPLDKQCFFQEMIRTLQATETRPLSILVQEGTQFLHHWDSNILQDFQSLRSGILYCGAHKSPFSAENVQEDYVPAFTYVESFQPWKESFDVPLVACRALHRKGPNIPLVWASMPLLMPTELLKAQQWACQAHDCMLGLTQEVQVWSSRDPIALVSNDRPMYSAQSSRLRYPTDKMSLLGLKNKSDYLEVIAKFGSLAALQWALSL